MGASTSSEPAPVGAVPRETVGAAPRAPVAVHSAAYVLCVACVSKLCIRREAAPALLPG